MSVIAERARQTVLRELESVTDVQRDDAYKTQAMFNITHHPAKYLRNWAANVGRLLFSYPFSLGPQSLTTYFYPP